jgi:CRISPR-associated protein Cas1
MKKLQNTLYILTPGSALSLGNEAVVVAVGGEEKLRVPAHGIDSVLCFGNTTVTTPLIQFCGERGIALSWFSENGRFYGRTVGPVHGNILLRRQQFRALEDGERRSAIVRSILVGKLVNSRETLLRAAREAADDEARERLKTAAMGIGQQGGRMEAQSDVDSLRGLEGAAARLYFEVFPLMIKTKDRAMSFDGRSHRPPEDPVNALLSYLYTLLKNDVQSALEGVGLDPACGYLHTLRPGRPALALDIMEELRSPLCDRLALALLNRGQINGKSFENPYPPYRLTDTARKTVITAWQKRKQEPIQHPFLDERIPIGLIPHCQSMVLARVLRGELDVYPPFHWR